MRCVSIIRPAIAVAAAFWAVQPAGAGEPSPQRAGGKPLVPPVLLPDGQEFTTWEVPLKFSRTYYVAQGHPRASDDNPGTEDRPFLTINRAAQVLRPGERVVVGPGVYRERVCPARGGTGPDKMISYEAAPGAEVVIRGSQVLDSPWALSPPDKRPASPASPKVWKTHMPAEMFRGENPFAQRNLTDEQIDRCMPWAVGTKGKVPNTLRRGLVFQDDRRLRQVAARNELAKASGAYWVEDDGLTLHVRPFGNVDPNRARFEVTTLGTIFAPEEYGLGYIRVKGFTIEHCANRFPRPQQGALSPMRGHHWIIEGNRVRECNAIGIDVGDQFDTAGPELAQGGQHVVRANTITDCGIGGIEGKGIEHTLIERNLIRRCGWQDIWRIYEVGGIKVHCTQSSVVRGNLVTDTVSAPGIWMDYANVNSRCTGNVTINVQCSNGGIFMEASQQPNMVDHNIVWATRGNGIYQHDCDELLIAQNLVARSTDAGVRMRICRGRKVLGRLSTAKRNRILNNLLVDNARPLAISDPENTSNYNVFGSSGKPFALEAWQKQNGWDRQSVVRTVRAELDAETLQLRLSVEGNLPACPAVPYVGYDFLGRARPADRTLPGPFAAVPGSPVCVWQKLSVSNPRSEP